MISGILDDLDHAGVVNRIREGRHICAFKGEIHTRRRNTGQGRKRLLDPQRAVRARHAVNIKRQLMLHNTITGIINGLCDRRDISLAAVKVNICTIEREVDGCLGHTIKCGKCLFDAPGTVCARHAFDLEAEIVVIRGRCAASAT